MDYLKGLNVIILSLLLILTGCFGMLSDDEEDSVEAQNPDDTTTVTATLTAQDIADAMILASNSPPKISVKNFEFSEDDWDETTLFQNDWHISGVFVCVDESMMVNDDGDHIGYTLEEQRASMAEDLDEGEVVHLANLIEVGDCVLYFEFVSVDPDGDAMTKGIDTDFDGIIDIPITPNQGTTLIGVDNSTVKDTFNLLSSDTCDFIDVAFIAVDEHGASTAEFMHFLGFDSCDDDEDMSYYEFSGIDDSGSGDGSVIVTYTSGTDLSLNNLMFTVSVDGAASQTLSNCDEGFGEPCYSHYIEDWYVGDSIVIDTDCTSVCTIYLTITDLIDGTDIGAITIDTE
mgnify:CR=1 FL=1|tara:strand:+ start:946 stop:1977 length:1032 start_codon:yes stop_codon:yes gene_type:complete